MANAVSVGAAPLETGVAAEVLNELRRRGLHGGAQRTRPASRAESTAARRWIPTRLALRICSTLVDPLTHTFTGAALAVAGLRRKTPLATAALIVGANLPDIDALSYLTGDYRALAFRRGVTHGVLAVVLLPLLLTAALLLWDRWVRRRRQPNAPPASAAALLAVSALAVVTHPTLDWLNNYGLRWLMPFDGRWFYGDTLFIVDPWLWLGLGGALFLGTSRHKTSLVAWGVLWILMSAVVSLGAPLLPGGALLAWFAIAALLFVLRAVTAIDAARAAKLATAALVLAVAYITTLGIAARAAHSIVARALVADGLDVEQVMVAPVPANPFRGQVVAATADAFYSGQFDWLAEPKLRIVVANVPRPKKDATYRAAAATPEAQRFLTWSRFPYVEVDSTPDGGRTVHFFDARYGAAGGLIGPTVYLDRNLVPTQVR